MKKGDGCLNCRGMTLRSVVEETLASILKNKLSHKIDNKLDETQYGLRNEKKKIPSSQSEEQLRNASRKIKSYICFIGFDTKFEFS